MPDPASASVFAPAGDRAESDRRRAGRFRRRGGGRFSWLAPIFAAAALAGPWSGRAQASGAAAVNVTVDAGQTVRTVDSRVFGLNTAAWDGQLDTSQTVANLQATGAAFLRFPGGSTADAYHWSTNTVYQPGDSNYATENTDFDQFADLPARIHGQAVITANYGTGSAQEAAAWVAYSNTTKGYGFKYWEIGNECYGTWEDDTQPVAHDPYTYANQVKAYIAAMKAADPTIKIGIVVATGEDSYANNTSHPATNPRTNSVHNGWTPVLLATLKSLGVTPDFAVYHRYEQAPLQETDAGLLQAALTWPNDAADLRQQLTDYLGTAGASVELLVTENNSVSYDPGKQSVSLVNGLYLADSFCNVLQTEFNAFVWWDLYNGQTANTAANPISLSSSLYGWRQYGDYGIANTDQVSFYPTYYVWKLLTRFVAGGDTVVRASSDSSLLSAYAARRTDGSLTILVINKDPANTQTVAFSVEGFGPQANATVYSYGVAQDNAAQPTGSGSPDLAVSTLTNAGVAFTASFAPYSVSVLSFISSVQIATQPSPAALSAGGSAPLSVAAAGIGPFSYQWLLDGVAVTGATSAHYTATAPGYYSVAVSNGQGSITSSRAAVSGGATRIVNISTRAQIGTGGNVAIAGLVVRGAAGGTESVLIRGVGPTLAKYGVSTPLAQPVITVTDSQGNEMASNTGWTTAPNSAQIAATASQVGAFALSDPSNNDSALLANLAPGAYSVKLSGVSDGTGIGLVEVYESATGSERLANISTRAQVGTGADVLIAGFVIRGPQSETVLIRGVGPALTNYGVTGVLAQPVLTVSMISGTTTTQVASNTGWSTNSNSADIAAVSQDLGAFALSSGSADCAVLTTLQPGTYSAQLSGLSGSTGVGLLEVYQVP